MKKMPLVGKPESLLARKIIKAYEKTGFVGVIVYAPRGYGKSSFAIKTLFDLYHNGFGLDYEDAYQHALDNTLYDLPEITNRIKYHLDIDTPAPALIFDDAGVYFSGQAYGMRYKWHALLKSFLDTIRLASSCIIMTTPNIDDLVSYVRRHDDHVVRIKKESGDFRRMATIYRQYTLPSGMKRNPKVGETEYSCFLPDNVYEQYSVKRKKMLEVIVDEMMIHIKESEKKERLMKITEKYGEIKLKQKVMKIKEAFQ